MALTVNQLRISKGGRPVLDIPSLTLAPGQLHVLLGPNGAGKSTLIGALAGLERGALSHVEIMGRTLRDWDGMELARARALLSQDHSVPFDFSVRDIVRMGRHAHSGCPHPHEEGLVMQALERAGAAHLADRYHAQLSGGEKARVHLARVLAQVWPQAQQKSERWLMLDEPTAALDLAHQHAVMRMLQQLATDGMGVVVVLHDLNLAQSYADRVLVMQGGHVVSEGACEAVLQPNLIERVWGVVCQRLPRSGSTRGWLVFS